MGPQNSQVSMGAAVRNYKVVILEELVCQKNSRDQERGKAACQKGGGTSMHVPCSLHRLGYSMSQRNSGGYRMVELEAGMMQSRNIKRCGKS